MAVVQLGADGVGGPDALGRPVEGGEDAAVWISSDLRTWEPVKDRSLGGAGDQEITDLSRFGSGLIAGVFFAFSNFVMGALARHPDVDRHDLTAVELIVSGGAPLNPEVGLFFHSLGLTLLQGYGQTEAGPVISCNRPKAGVRMDTVGPPLLNTEVRIAGDGEIMVRGENVMHGYWRNPEETARVLRDGHEVMVPIEQVDVVIPVKPERCSRCQPLLHGEDGQPQRHQVTEIPPVRPIVTA